MVGDEWIAVVNDEAGDNSLILARPELAGQRDIVQLTTTQVFARTSNPIAISGDGRTILFVDADNFIRAIRSDGSGEQVISGSGDWASIALSPDGKRLAAVTVHRDSTLYILDMEDPAGGKDVRLYNPTTQRDVRAYVTLFADALDWDHAGERVLFDAFNSVEGDSTALSLWRINVLDVDNELIFPVLPAQPPNISLGNPSFAQTNDNFFTFDRVDFDTESGEIWAVDLFRGTVALVERNADSIGHPQYSPDDSELVFQRLEAGCGCCDGCLCAKTRCARRAHRPPTLAARNCPGGLPSAKSRRPSCRPRSRQSRRCRQISRSIRTRPIPSIR